MLLTACRRGSISSVREGYVETTPSCQRNRGVSDARMSTTGVVSDTDTATLMGLRRPQANLPHKPRFGYDVSLIWFVFMPDGTRLFCWHLGDNGTTSYVRARRMLNTSRILLVSDSCEKLSQQMPSDSLLEPNLSGRTRPMGFSYATRKIIGFARHIAERACVVPPFQSGTESPGRGTSGEKIHQAMILLPIGLFRLGYL